MQGISPESSISRGIATKGNIGIALNYERAENYMFKALGRPYALFLEDDLVLSPQYLTVNRSLTLRESIAVLRTYQHMATCGLLNMSSGKGGESCSTCM